MLLVTTINQSQPGVFAREYDLKKVSATFAWVKGVSLSLNRPNHVFGNPTQYL